MLTLFAVLLLAMIAPPNIVIAAELIAGLKRYVLPLISTSLPRTAILVPAHNEAAGIATMLSRVVPLLPVGTRLLVVADNCTDGTATFARAAGAEVTERHDPAARGKGHALAHGRAVLAVDPPEVVIVLDADCIAEPGAIERLARGAMTLGRPMQAIYLFEPQPAAAPMVQISGFAFLVKNLVRQTGLARLGVPAVLTGSGMAFPWHSFATAPLATDNIVEDLALGIALARAGDRPCFDPGARVWSMPAGTGGTLSQRTRWEHGFISTAKLVTLPLLLEGLRRGQPGLAWLGLHVAVPPLALLLVIDAAALVLIGLLSTLGAALLPLVLAFALVGVVAFSVVAAWARYGRDQVSAAALIRAPIYLLWKLPIYLKLVRRPETRWIRTDRE